MEKDKLGLVGDPELTDALIRQHFDGASIEAGAKKVFEMSKYRVNISEDEAGLEFTQRDGTLQIDDPGRPEAIADVNGDDSDMEEGFNMEEDVSDGLSIIEADVAEAEGDTSFNMEEDAANHEAIYPDNDEIALDDDDSDDTDDEGGDENESGPEDDEVDDSDDEQQIEPDDDEPEMDTDSADDQKVNKPGGEYDGAVEANPVPY